MLSQISDVIRRSGATLVQDMAGAVALLVLLLAALHLPGLS